MAWVKWCGPSVPLTERSAIWTKPLLVIPAWARCRRNVGLMPGRQMIRKKNVVPANGVDSKSGRASNLVRCRHGRSPRWCGCARRFDEGSENRTTTERCVSHCGEVDTKLAFCCRLFFVVQSIEGTFDP